MGKVCSKCKTEKGLTEFGNDKLSKDGLRCECKECKHIADKKYNKSKKGKLRRNKYKQSEKGKDGKKKYRQSDKGKQSAIKQQQTYLSKFKYVHRCRQMLWAVKLRMGVEKSGHTHEVLRYSADTFKRHLESLGMDWDVHEIDHKIPASWFKKDTPLYLINDLRNLQPLTPEENRSKCDNYADDVPEEYYKLIEGHLRRMV